MDRLLPCLRHTFRLLFKSPGFTVTAVLILAFGIGANTAIFSLINAVLLNRLPYPKSSELVYVEYTRSGASIGINYPDYLDLFRNQHSLQSLAVSFPDDVDLTGRGEPIRLKVQFGSASIFQVTGNPFIEGRPFTEQEDRAGGPLLVVLTEHCWKDRFGSDPTIIGKNLVLSGQSFQVAGVCPQQLNEIWPGTDCFIPINVLAVYGYDLQKRAHPTFFCIGRLKPGASAALARSDLAVVQEDLAARFQEDKGIKVVVTPLLDAVVKNYAGIMWLLGLAAGCLLLISCANISNLLLVRSFERRNEMSIRAALGASRSHLVGQFMLETLFLSLIGGALGLIMSSLGIDLIKAYTPQTMYRFVSVNLEVPVVLFGFVATLSAALLCGVIPAWSLTNSGLAKGLSDEVGRSGTVGRRRQRTQSILIGGQVASACVLTIAAGLFSRSLEALRNTDLGYAPNNIVVATIYPTANKYAALPVLRSFFAAVLAKSLELPGVTGASMTNELPFSLDFGYNSYPFEVVGQPEPSPGAEPAMDPQNIFPGYFKTLRIPLLQGRDFDVGDDMNGRKVTIVTAELAQRFFPNQNPIGKQIIDPSPSEGRQPWTIVGVVGNSYHNSPNNGPGPVQAYFPVTQRWQIGSEFLILRTSSNASALAPTIRKGVASIDPDVPVTEIGSFEQMIEAHFLTYRIAAVLLGLFSAAALLLSATGLYGILAYTVSQRRREVGIRMALGAKSVRIVALVIGQGARLVLVGLAVGIVTGLLAGRLLESLLYGVSGHDPESLFITVLVLTFSAAVACFIPAWRALQVKPMDILHE